MSSSTSVRVRFAPSPTGELHIGGARTALYNFLFARHHGGTFILRIEDTDRERFVAGSDVRIFTALSALGMTPDEGAVLSADGTTIVDKGEFGPYVQSQRLAIYRSHADHLVAHGLAYPCFCTEERLTQLRETQQLAKTKTGYDRHCRTIDPADAQSRITAGERHVLRMAMPTEGAVTFTDVIRGAITFAYAEADDFVLLKSDGYPTYHFANVVDDHAMQISHVIRAEEWISSTPKHIALYKAFGWDHPTFAHLPILINPDRSKLSKRQGDVAAIDYLNKGYLPEALINFIALLGFNPRGDQEVYTIQELIEGFNLEKVGASSTMFSHEKLDWLNRQYLQRLSDDQWIELITPVLRAKGCTDFSPRFLRAVVGIERERMQKVADAGEESGFLFREIVISDPSMLVWKKSTADATREILTSLNAFLSTLADETWDDIAAFTTAVEAWIAQQNLAKGDVLWPMRVALTGLERSPDPFRVAVAHGKQKSLVLLARAYELLSKA